jgi:Na+/melibiose symporter-like transporter
LESYYLGRLPSSTLASRSLGRTLASRQWEPKLSFFLSGLPLWAAASLLVVLPTIAAMCGLILIRRRVGLERLATNNEIAGFKFATVGVIYAVLLAFAVIVVWEKFNEAETAVVQEAGAAATLYRLASGPEPEAVATRVALTNYLRLAIDRDWPQMAAGKESHEVTQALDAVYAAALRLTDKSSRQPAIFVEMFKQLDAITQARRVRLHVARGIVPGVLWTVLVCGAVLTVGFTFFFGTENLPAQAMMTGILSVLVFMGLLVIVSIDYPFTGPVHIGGGPLQHVVEDFAHG